MVIVSRAFWDLLPYRIDQALMGRAVRRLRVGYRRRQSVQAGARAPAGPRRLFVDLAVISKNDAGTGIQRVVRALALGLIEEGSADWAISFVSATRRRLYHRIAWPQPGESPDFTGIEVRPGDVFLGLDYSLDAVRQNRRQLARFRQNGGQLWFLIHDLLPLERPDWFSRNTVIRYKAWLEILAGTADGFLCNSAETETQLKRALFDLYGMKHEHRTTVLPMGHDILDPVARDKAHDGASLSQRVDLETPFSLMVGTLEPRKGHADIVAAFGELWRSGSADRLILVGRMGWEVHALRERIVTHAEYGRKLFWFDDVGDLELYEMYEACEGVIIASHGEGFGLPLIEALGHGKPVLARDLPVFAAHAHHGVRYFPADADPRLLAHNIRGWIRDIRAGQVTVIRPSSDWREATRILLASIAGHIAQDG